MTAPTVSKTLKYNPAVHKLITVAAGCFWGTEHIYRKHLDSKIVDCKVGFANGNSDPTSYKEVCSGTTGYTEGLQIAYDPSVTNLTELLDFFFKIHDPTQLNHQGPDRGTQYRSGIYTESAEDLKLAEEIKAKWQPKWGNKIVTEVQLITSFFDAEEYHQLYLHNNPHGYACPTHYVRDL